MRNPLVFVTTVLVALTVLVAVLFPSAVVASSAVPVDAIPDQFDIQRVGTVTALIALLILVVRTAVTRKWVPGAYFEDMRSERDGARAELKETALLLKTSVDAHAQLQRTHATAIDTQAKLVEQNGQLLRDPHNPAGHGAGHGSRG